MAARFVKAQPKQARLKVSVYGPPGSGKTFTTLLWAEGLAKVRERRVAFVDTERGTDFYVQTVKSRAVHPVAFDIDCIYTKSIAEVTEAVRSLDPKEHGIIVLDSVSHLWDACMDAYKGRRTKADTIPMHAWSAIKKPYKDLISFLIGSPFDVFILGRQKNLFDTDEATGEMKKTGVAMRAEGETAYEPHMCVRMESVGMKFTAHVEKDRTGVLAGKQIHNPSFATIEPLLPLLGEEQAGAEDEDERIAKDGELMAKNDEKAAAKESKSMDLFRDLQAKFTAAGDLASFSAVAAEANKAKRYMIEEHWEATKQIATSKREKLVQAAAPSMN